MPESTSAEMPAAMCTTVPPAKSSTPYSYSQPPGAHTQCASGQYTNVDHSRMNHTYAEKRMRSATAPLISAGVMMANLPWNITNTSSGMALSPNNCCGAMPLSATYSGDQPIQPP